MRESVEDKIVLNDVPREAIKQLMRYIYTGSLSLESLDLSTVVDLVDAAHMYGFEELLMALRRFLLTEITVHNVGSIYSVASALQLEDLERACCDLMDSHGSQVLGADSLFDFSASALCKVLSRDTFFAEEVEIFGALQCWFSYQPNGEVIPEVL